MKSRRAALALAVLAATFVAQASCAGVVGVDTEGLRNVIKDMCDCEAVGGLPTLKDCEEKLSKRFMDASSATSTDWLARYQGERCDLCDNALKCLSAEPTCSVIECTRTEECCQLSNAVEVKCVDSACQ